MRKQRGVGLIEVLVTVLVVSVGLLGLAGLQNESLRVNHNAYLETQGQFLAQDIIDRMRLTGSPDAYLRGFGAAIETPADCTASACSPTALAIWDLQDWMEQLGNVLGPDGDAKIERGELVNEFSITIRYNDLRGTTDQTGGMRELAVVTRI